MIAYINQRGSRLIIEKGSSLGRLNSGLSFEVSGVTCFELGAAVNLSTVPVTNVHSGVVWSDRSQRLTGAFTFTQPVSGVDATSLGQFVTLRQLQNNGESGLAVRVTVLESNSSGLQTQITATQTSTTVLKTNQSGLMAQGIASQGSILILSNNQSGIQNQLGATQGSVTVLANNQSGLTAQEGSTQSRVTTLESNFSGLPTPVAVLPIMTWGSQAGVPANPSSGQFTTNGTSPASTSQIKFSTTFRNAPGIDMSVFWSSSVFAFATPGSGEHILLTDGRGVTSIIELVGPLGSAPGYVNFNVTPSNGSSSGLWAGDYNLSFCPGRPPVTSVESQTGDVFVFPSRISKEGFALVVSGGQVAWSNIPAILGSNQSGISTTQTVIQGQVLTLQNNFSGLQNEANNLQTFSNTIAANQSGLAATSGPLQSQILTLISNFSGLQASLVNYVPRQVAGKYRFKADGTFQNWNPTQLGWQGINFSGVSGEEIPVIFPSPAEA